MNTNPFVLKLAKELNTQSWDADIKPWRSTQPEKRAHYLNLAKHLITLISARQVVLTK